MAKAQSIWNRQALLNAAGRAFVKLSPLVMWRNPVMFIVEIGSLVATYFAVHSLFSRGPFGFFLQVAVWLWFTVIFANFAEALSEIRGKAQADTLRRTRSETIARRIASVDDTRPPETVPALALRRGDLVLIESGEPIPGDGEIVQGTALVDESAITGESSPVIREAGSDRSAVTGGTRLLSGRIVVKIAVNPGDTFIDRMISMVESARRQKTPNERALEILLIGLTILFIVLVATVPALGHYSGVTVAVPVLLALLVCLMPTTIGGLLPAIGIAGMDRLLQHNVIALSGRSIEAAGDVDVVLLDKTGTITLGNRMATEFLTCEGVTASQLAEAALLSSLADETPEGRSIVTLAKKELNLKGSDIKPPASASFIPFRPETRISGIDYNGKEIRKGASDAVADYVRQQNGSVPETVQRIVTQVARDGGTPLVVAEGRRVLGVVRLKDVLKEGIKDRMERLTQMGIRTIMITGDNPLTASAIAAESGVQDFVAQARPEIKLELIRKHQSEGHMVAMIGDGTNDAPALAQADVAVAMNAGTQVARESANMVDLDSNPTKLLDIIEIGKQILITRGSLTTFSIVNDIAKYFAIIPAIFAVRYPALGVLNLMRLRTPESAVLAAVIFNAIIIPFLIPLALRGVKYTHARPTTILIRNLLIYGLGGIVLPFVAIKVLDLIISLLHLVGR
jgi:K+-transporting ATPase ATPase B chain